MKRGGAMLSVLTLFLVGILAGALATHIYYTSNSPPPGGFQIRGPGPGGPHRLPRGPKLFERIRQDLALTDEQAEEIREILRESHEQGRAIRIELEPRVREHMEKTRDRIRELLTPEQREKFEELQKRERPRAERFLLGPPPPRER